MAVQKTRAMELRAHATGALLLSLIEPIADLLDYKSEKRESILSAHPLVHIYRAKG